ncbi:hypothetical protein [Bradyrhizobium guangdongense]
MFFATNYLTRLVGFHTPLIMAWLLFSLVFFAVGLYGLRLWSRLLYGMVEIVVGVLITLAAINTYGVAQTREYAPIVGGGVFHRPPEGVLQLSGPNIALLGMLAAVYLLVRGLDNVGEGLREGKHLRLGARWQRFFPNYRR